MAARYKRLTKRKRGKAFFKDQFSSPVDASAWPIMRKSLLILSGRFGVPDTVAHGLRQQGAT